MKTTKIVPLLNNPQDEREQVSSVMRQINEAWLAGQVEDIGAMVHDDIVMVFPGFAGRIQGRDKFVAGFRDFCETATIHQFKEGEYLIDIVGETAVVSFGYEMIYERSAEKYHATGRDLWIFEKQATGWIALWRMMLDLSEAPAETRAQ